MGLPQNSSTLPYRAAFPPKRIPKIPIKSPISEFGNVQNTFVHLHTICQRCVEVEWCNFEWEKSVGISLGGYPLIIGQHLLTAA